MKIVRPDAISLYSKEPMEEHHYPFAVVCHFVERDEAKEFYDEMKEDMGDE